MNSTLAFTYLKLPVPALPSLRQLVAQALNKAAAIAPPPRRLTRAQEAAPVREMAWRLRSSDPGFSADLYAAAARHEALDDLEG
jgi:hypothetical protein